MSTLDPKEIEFVTASIRREALFFKLSMIGVAVGVGMLGLSAFRLFTASAAWGSSFVIAILILLNARQNLRQHKYARVLRRLGSGLLDPKSGDDGKVV